MKITGLFGGVYMGHGVPHIPADAIKSIDVQRKDDGTVTTIVALRPAQDPDESLYAAAMRIVDARRFTETLRTMPRVEVSGI